MFVFFLIYFYPCKYFNYDVVFMAWCDFPPAFIRRYSTLAVHRVIHDSQFLSMLTQRHPLDHNAPLRAQSNSWGQGYSDSSVLQGVIFACFCLCVLYIQFCPQSQFNCLFRFIYIFGLRSVDKGRQEEPVSDHENEWLWGTSLYLATPVWEMNRIYDLQ